MSFEASNTNGLVENRCLHPEAAAGIAGDNAYLAFRHLEHLRKLGARRMRPLHGRIDHVATISGIVVADGAARLHGSRGNPIDDKAMPHDMARARKSGIDRRLVVADQLDKADVVGAIVPHARCAWLRRLGRRGDRRQFLVVDLDELCRILRLRHRLGHDERDIVADPAHAVFREDRITRLVHRRAVAPLETARYREIAIAGCFHVCRSQHSQHAGRRFRGLDINRLYLCVSIRRSQHDTVGHPR